MFGHCRWVTKLERSYPVSEETILSFHGILLDALLDVDEVEPSDKT